MRIFMKVWEHKKQSEIQNNEWHQRGMMVPPCVLAVSRYNKALIVTLNSIKCCIIPLKRITFSQFK